MKQLIKYHEDHFIIIDDDLEIEKGDFVFLKSTTNNPKGTFWKFRKCDFDSIYFQNKEIKKVTHSSKLLEKNGFNKIKQINSDFIKVYLENYDIIKFGNKSIEDLKYIRFESPRERMLTKMFYARGFNKHRELIQLNHIFANQKTEWDIELRDDDTIQIL